MTDDDMLDLSARLARIVARREVARRDYAVEVARAVARHGVGPVRQAVRGRPSADEIAAVARQGEDLMAQRPAGLPERDAYEVAQRYSAGLLTADETVALLVSWPYGVSWHTADDEPDPYGVDEPDSFAATVVRAFTDGLLDVETYERVLRGRG